MPICLGCKEANVLEADDLCPACSEKYKVLPDGDVSATTFAAILSERRSTITCPDCNEEIPCSDHGWLHECRAKAKLGHSGTPQPSDGGPAFPTVHIPDSSPPAWSGMSVRTWLTGMALQGLLSNPALIEKGYGFPERAREAVAQADALLAQLSKPKEP